jgi:hypothetical protein
MLPQQIMMQLFGLLCCATFYFSYSWSAFREESNGIWLYARKIFPFSYP